MQVKFDANCLKQEKVTFTHKQVVDRSVVKNFLKGSYNLEKYRLPWLDDKENFGLRNS